MIIGIEIGGTNFRIGALDKNNIINSYKKLSIRDVIKSNDILSDLKYTIENNFKDIKIDAISIGIPGTLDADRKIVVQVPNIKGFDNVNIVDYLNEYFNVPVFIERDVNMLIKYDLFDNKIDDKGIVIAFYYGTGIGNAIVINGEIYTGKDGAAGEVGHIPVDNCYEECGCGNIGCIEAIAGGKYLAKLQKEKYPNTHISNMFVEHTKDPEIIKFINRMAIALATEINILNPNKILLGGGVINMKSFPFDLFFSELKKHVRKPYPYETLDITIARNNEQAGVIGACLYAKNKLGVN